MRLENKINRRSFIKTGLTGVAGAGILGNKNIKTENRLTNGDDVKIKEYRMLGRTGFKVSDISLGAADLSNPGVLQEAINLGTTIPPRQRVIKIGVLLVLSLFFALGR